RITNIENDISFESLLSDYRSRGGSLYACTKHQMNGYNNTNSAVVVPKKPRTPPSAKPGQSFELHNQTAADGPHLLDCFDITNHQAINVLFCSYSYTSLNAPNFCVKPW